MSAEVAIDLYSGETFELLRDGFAELGEFVSAVLIVVRGQTQQQLGSHALGPTDLHNRNYI